MRSLDELANMKTWSIHFRMRGFLAIANSNEMNFEHYFKKAAILASEAKVIRINSVRRIDFLIKTIAGLMKVKGGIESSKARRLFTEHTILDEEIYDSTILEFIDNAVLGLETMKNNRRLGLSKIGQALQALDRLPLLGESDRNAFSVALDHEALKVIEGKRKLHRQR